MSVRVSIEVAAPRARVWEELSRLEDHVEWMMDAKAIRFRSAQRTGVGTVFECDTRVGPIRLTDVLEVTKWEPEERIDVVHRGVVSGTGAFVLRDASSSATEVEWEERLEFPWWLGAGMGALVARPVFAGIWQGNLRRLRRRIEAAPHRQGQGPEGVIT